LVYFRDSSPYIPGSHYKTTTFIKINNVSTLKYLINIVRQQNQASLNKSDTSYGECLFFLFFRICRAPESTWMPANFTQSTAEIVVAYSTIHDKAPCTTMYMYPRGGSRPFHNGGRFITETIFFLKIKRYRDVIQSENYQTW
jgi:hypothetical protein